MTKDWKFFINDQEVEESVYNKIIAEHEAWVKEEQKKKDEAEKKALEAEKKAKKKK